MIRLSLRVFLAAAVLCSDSYGANDEVYFFVDEYGVPHFSNHQLEPRYKPFMREVVTHSEGATNASSTLDPLEIPGEIAGSDIEGDRKLMEELTQGK